MTLIENLPTAQRRKCASDVGSFAVNLESTRQNRLAYCRWEDSVFRLPAVPSTQKRGSSLRPLVSSHESWPDKIGRQITNQTQLVDLDPRSRKIFCWKWHGFVFGGRS